MTVSACAKELKWEAAVALLRPCSPSESERETEDEPNDVSEAFAVPDLPSHCSAVLTCQSVGQWKEAAQILKAMEQLSPVHPASCKPAVKPSRYPRRQFPPSAVPPDAFKVSQE
eukprot:CAMPEP_0197696662 /NCGR_PEP_ID=MMETSP1338-20131121/116950_1 /TAXON_ID=43686 ORGANISM="Pelagodinium beii, Strain RCC1491" /NCGR_SAMPLE_ID=MMETSP1338 /ASSEMBLY_ACC=CAM_ASM_000754 /LENGTH=113 /DNA_ID=CAMNT_0043279809 /DNA_START=93 /DNA_END=434 /DNA_ORIENTATION=-